jgi:2-polyprenyl-3-methyl-5-hydroxy-6-metoxy-1,4-benzoquinol methylase
VTSFDHAFWEERWARALAGHRQDGTERPPNSHLVAELGELEPGLALDAGCGDGVNAIWLAQRGWRVLGVDISESALAIARSRAAAAAGASVAERIEWCAADLQHWTPTPGAYDLVMSLYVHIPGPTAGMVARLATGVAPAGTLFFAGHSPHERHGDPETHSGEREVDVASIVAALNRNHWEFERATDRVRRESAVDTLIRARRLA